MFLASDQIKQTFDVVDSKLSDVHWIFVQDTIKPQQFTYSEMKRFKWFHIVKICIVAMKLLPYPPYLDTTHFQYTNHQFWYYSVFIFFAYISYD